MVQKKIEKEKSHREVAFVFPIRGLLVSNDFDAAIIFKCRIS